MVLSPPPPLEFKFLIFKTIIRPKFTYACQVSGVAAEYLLYKLQRKQNRILKHMSQLPRYVDTEKVHKELKIDSVGNYIKKAASKFFPKINNIRNPTLLALNERASLTASTCRKRPRKTLELQDFATVKKRRPVTDASPSNSKLLSSPFCNQVRFHELCIPIFHLPCT